jgi:hypothetical protein
MAKVSTGYTFGLTITETLAAQMMAKGCTEKEVLRDLYKITEDTPIGDRNKATRKLHKLMGDPKFQECFRTIVTQATMPSIGKASSKIIEQIDNENAWLANKAANDVLTRFWPTVMGDDSKQITVKIEGMPDMGEPGAEDE